MLTNGPGCVSAFHFGIQTNALESRLVRVPRFYFFLFLIDVSIRVLKLWLEVCDPVALKNVAGVMYPVLRLDHFRSWGYWNRTLIWNVFFNVIWVIFDRAVDALWN